jgi:molybdate transport system substrate-binding protein
MIDRMRSGRSVAELVRDAVRKVVFAAPAAAPVAIWDGEPKRTSIEHDGVHDGPPASPSKGEIAMKLQTAIIGIAMVLSLALPANGQFAGPKVSDAKLGDVRVLVTAAIREPLNAVLKQAEAAIGKPIVVEYGSARGNLKNEILKGQDFEVAILLPDVNDEIQAAGKIAPGRFEIARVPVAFGLRGEAPNLDVRSPAAVKATMLNAKSVKYAPTGAALMTVRKILSTFDIADKIHDSSAVVGAVPLAASEYEINIYPLSEIIPNKGVKNLGAVIPELQVPVIIEATVGMKTNDPKAARALIDFLKGPAIDQALKDDGMEKGHIGK